jgi:hypothetical protein
LEGTADSEAVLDDAGHGLGEPVGELLIIGRFQDGIADSDGTPFPAWNR